MTSSPEERSPPAARDEEHALRLLLNDWVSNGRITGAAFRTRGKKSPKYVSVSLFLKERLPNHDGSALHIERFASWGRARLAVGHIRSASRVVGDIEQPLEFDLVVTGSAEPPLEALGSAHANLVGPTQKPAAATALAEAFNQHGEVEKAPD